MIYEFICNNCKYEYDEFKRVGDFLSVCPICGHTSTKKISLFNSNFSEWSDTLNAKRKWATTPEDFSDS